VLIIELGAGGGMNIFVILLMLMIILDDDTHNDNESASSAVENASMSSRRGASSVCGEGDGHQILRVAGSILNIKQETFDKGCPPLSWLEVLLTIQQPNSLLR
jgi:hypothetical protein